MKIPRNKRFEYVVEPKDVDLMGRATMVSVFDYILRTAHLDAQRHKIGVYDIRKQNMAWVVSRAVVEQYTTLKNATPFKIATWLSDCNRVAVTRNYMILDEDNNAIGHAVTQWSIIDFVTRQSINLLNLHRITKHLHPEYPNAGLFPKKLQSIGETENIVAHKVVYSDLDFNGHVNSLKYMQWMLDTLPIEWASNRKLWHFDVNYIREIHLGENPVVLYNITEDSTFFEVQNGQQKVACRAEMLWKPFK